MTRPSGRCCCCTGLFTTLLKPLQLPSHASCFTADHIVAVYQGGGLCDLDNLRTLCVVCHAVSACAQPTLESRLCHQVLCMQLPVGPALHDMFRGDLT